MTKAAISRSLREAAGGDWISWRQLKAWLRSGSSETNKIVDGLDYRAARQAHLYFVPDVADRVMRQVVKGWS